MKTFCMGFLLLVAGVAVAQAQSQEGKPQQPADHQSQTTQSGATTAATAHVLVYRQRRYAGSGLAPSIYIDNKPVVRIGNGRRASVRLAPGLHSIRSDDKSSAISIEAKPGEEYYVRVDEEPGLWKGHGKLTLVLPEQGRAEYHLQKPVEEDRKLDKELVEDDTQVAEKKSGSKSESK
jgi:hypothetical protein